VTELTATGAPSAGPVPAPGRLRELRAHGWAAMRSAGLLAVAGASANAANVIVTVIIARLLTGREYGGQAQLVAVFVVLSMPGSALLVGVVRQVTALQAGGGHDRLDAWTATVRRRLVLGLVGLAVLAVALRWWLARLLGLPGATGVAEVVVAGGGWALLSVERGLLQSRLAYPALARNLAIEGATRSGVTMVCVLAGSGIEGVALGLLAAMVTAVADASVSVRGTAATAPVPAVAWAVAPAPEALPPPSDAELDAASPEGPVPSGVAPSVTRHPSASTGLDAGAASPPAAAPTLDGGDRPRREPATHLGADLTAAVAALGLLAALQYGDLVITGREAPAQAGGYAAISVACKALVFGAVVLSGYLLPEAVWRWHHGRHALGPLGLAVGLICVPAVVLVAAATVAPDRLLRVVFGPKLVGAAPAFAPLALAMTALAISFLLTTYLLGIGHRAVVWVLVVAVGAISTAVGMGGGSPTTTAHLELIGQVVLCAALAVMVGRRHPGGRHPSPAVTP